MIVTRSTFTISISCSRNKCIVVRQTQFPFGENPLPIWIMDFPGVQDGNPIGYGKLGYHNIFNCCNNINI